eukprot:350168-Chlamydomonas_euryale.AAC.4
MGRTVGRRGDAPWPQAKPHERRDERCVLQLNTRKGERSAVAYVVAAAVGRTHRDVLRPAKRAAPPRVCDRAVPPTRSRCRRSASTTLKFAAAAVLQPPSARRAVNAARLPRTRLLERLAKKALVHFLASSREPVAAHILCAFRAFRVLRPRRAASWQGAQHTLLHTSATSPPPPQQGARERPAPFKTPTDRPGYTFLPCQTHKAGRRTVGRQWAANTTGSCMPAGLASRSPSAATKRRSLASCSSSAPLRPCLGHVLVPPASPRPAGCFTSACGGAGTPVESANTRRKLRPAL